MAPEGLSRSAAYALVDWAIRCNVTQPGFYNTDLTAAIKASPAARQMTEAPPHTGNAVIACDREQSTDDDDRRVEWLVA
ncbi:MAG: hypothetical protein JOY78_08005 [Pseudonocardia sp.]|nr:hypothetical protein [Pseudonocardia sp.]